jgi:hypothetical protein
MIRTFLVTSVITFATFATAYGKAVVGTPTKEGVQNYFFSLAFGSSTENLGEGAVLVFVSLGKSDESARWEVMEKCEEFAYNCFGLPSISSEKVCRYVVAGFSRGYYRYAFGDNPEELVAECTRFVGDLTCSNATEIC